MSRSSASRHFTPLLFAAVLASPLAWAEYPEKPITLIVPWAAGGGTDATARIIASSLEEQLGQTINVVNRTGAAAWSVTPRSPTPGRMATPWAWPPSRSR